MTITADEFLDAAVETGLIEPEIGRSALAGGRGGEDAVERLAIRGRFPAEALYRAVAQTRGLPYVDATAVRPAAELVARLPASLLRRSRILPLRADDGSALLATSDPGDRHALEAATRVLGGGLQVALLEPEALEGLIARALDAGEPTQAPSQVDSVGLLDRILREAYLRRASDVHLEPQPDGLRVRVRIDGILHEIPVGLGPAERSALVSRLKVLAGLDIAEQRAAQDGGFNHRLPFLENAVLDIRVATLPTEWGERATLRLLGAESVELDMGALGMSAADLERFREVIHGPYGLVLLTGPTGSGKTTTLYAALSEINQPGINILTVEDPIERRIPGASQVHVGGSDKIGFGSALRAFFRHDPDVLMVGEVRDLETADAALKAAMTGHRVFSTLHTNSACGAVGRLTDIGCEPYRIAATLRAVVAQRLVRRVCPRCAGSRAARADELRYLGVEEAEVAEARGCASCIGTGFHGRIGLFESLWIDRELGSRIARGAGEDELEAAAGERLRTLRQDARAKVLAGVIAVDEAMRATELGV